MNKKKIVSILGLLLLVITVIGSYYLYIYFPEFTKSVVSRYFNSKFGVQVKFSYVNISISGGLRVADTYLSNSDGNDFVYVPELKINIDFLKLLRERQIVNSVSGLVLNKPKIYIENFTGLSGLTGSTGTVSISAGVNIPELDIALNNVEIISKKRSYSGIDGKITLKNGQCMVEIKQKSLKYIDSIYSKIVYDINNKKWNAEINNTNNINVFTIAAKGDLNYGLYADTYFKLKLDNYNFDGNGKISYSTGVVSFNGNLSSLLFNGKIYNGMMDINAKMLNCPLNMISSEFSSGKADFSLHITSSAAFPVMDAKVTINNIVTRNKAVNSVFSRDDLSKILLNLQYAGKAMNINGIAGNMNKSKFYVNLKQGNDSGYDVKFHVLNRKIELAGDVNYRPDKLTVNNCSILLSSGSFSVKGVTELNRKNVNKFSTEVKVNNYKYSKMAVSGVLHIDGAANYIDMVSCKFKSSNLNINNRVHLNNSGMIVYKDSQLTVKNLSVGTLLSAELFADFINEDLNGKLKLSDVNIADFTGIEGINGLSGKLSGEMNLSGKLPAPACSFVYSIQQGKYLNTGFSVNGTGNYFNKEISGSGKFFVNANIPGEFFVKYRLDSKNINTAIILPGITMLELAKYAGIGNIPISGKLATKINLSGTPGNVRKNIILSGSNLRYVTGILPDVWKRAELDFELGKEKKDGILINKMTAEFDNERIIELLPGSMINPEKFKFYCHFKNFKYDRIGLYGKFRMDGKYRTDKNGNFTLGSNFETNNLWVNQYNFINVKFKLGYKTDINKNRVITLTNYTTIKDYNISGKVSISSAGVIDGIDISLKNQDKLSFKAAGNLNPGGMNFSVDASNLDTEALASLFNSNISVSGKIDFVVLLSGTGADPYVTVNANVFNGSIMNIPFTNTNLQCNYRDGILNITNAKILYSKDKTEYFSISGKGKVPVSSSGNKRIDLRFAVDKCDLTVMKDFSELVKNVRGDLMGEVIVKGTSNRPVYTGYLRLINGEVSLRRYFDKLQKFNFDLQFVDNKLVISQFAGKIGDGQVKSEGYVIFDKLFSIAQYEIKLYTVGAKGVKIFIPELPISVNQFFKTTGLDEIFKTYSSGEPVFYLTLKSGKSVPKFSGYIQLNNTHFTYPPKHRGEGKSIFELPEDTELDIELKSGKNTWYESELVSANIYGSLKFTGTYNDININGKITSSKGRISYINKNFNVKEATFEVNKSVCYLESTAETAVNTKIINNNSKQEETVSDTIRMVIDRAQISNIQPRFVSQNNPGISQEEAIKRLWGLSVTVEKPGEPGRGVDIEWANITERNMFLRQQGTQLFNTTLASSVQPLLDKSGLVDHINVSQTQADVIAEDPDNPTIPELLSGTKYTLEKNISQNLLLGYGLTFKNVQKQIDLKYEIELAYRVKSNMFIRGSYGLDKDKPYKIGVENMWRFNW